MGHFGIELPPPSKKPLDSDVICGRTSSCSEGGGVAAGRSRAWSPAGDGGETLDLVFFSVLASILEISFVSLKRPDLFEFFGKIASSDTREKMYGLESSRRDLHNALL